MSSYKDETKRLIIGDWKVLLHSDEDGHLTVHIDNDDNTPVVECGADLSDETVWGERFTTEQIEANQQ